MSLDIVGIGMATIDRLYLLEDVSQLPAGTVLDYSVQGGGPAATAIAAAAVLGASCAMIARVGDDEPGMEILAGLKECGVDVSRTVVNPGEPSPVVIVLVDAPTGDRHFLGHDADCPLVGMEDIDWDYVSDARIVHMDGSLKDMSAALQKARALGLTTMVDTSLGAGLEADWVPLVDVFIGGADSPDWRACPDAALQTAERVAARGPHTAIATLGDAGCVGVGPEGTFRLPGFEVDVVDTTGTGDVFHGAYAYGLTRGWRAEDCARFANAAAALSATKLGGRAGLPTASQVADLLSAAQRAGSNET